VFAIASSAELERSFFERRVLSHQAGPGLVARVFLQHDVVFYPPVYFHPTVPEVVANPDRDRLIHQAHVFAGTWVEGHRERHTKLWAADGPLRGAPRQTTVRVW